MRAADRGAASTEQISAQEMEILDAFRRAGATDRWSAKPLSELGIEPGAAFMRLIGADVIRRASGEEYYVSEFAAAIDYEYGVALARYTVEEDARPELVAFTFRIRALIARMRRRPSRVHHEVIALLDGAWHAALRESRSTPPGTPCSLPIATAAFVEGAERLTQLEQSRGRFHYLKGLLYGLAVFVALPAIIVEQVRVGWTMRLGTPDMVAQVILFAGAGAVASVVTRLPSIDLSKETKNRILVFSGASRPIVAVLFAAVVFQIIRHDLVSIGAIDDPRVENAIIKVAAFLCGFSERFATDLLARLPILGSQSKDEHVRGTDRVPA